jgi:hypothetical protein
LRISEFPEFQQLEKSSADQAFVVQPPDDFRGAVDGAETLL